MDADVVPAGPVAGTAAVADEGATLDVGVPASPGRAGGGTAGVIVGAEPCGAAAVDGWAVSGGKLVESVRFVGPASGSTPRGVHEAAATSARVASEAAKAL